MPGNLGITIRTDENKPQRAAPESPPGTNSSNDITAQSGMYSEDTGGDVVATGIAIVSRMGNPHCLTKKSNPERGFADPQFRLVTMDKCLEQATTHARQPNHGCQPDAPSAWRVTGARSQGSRTLHDTHDTPPWCCPERQQTWSSWQTSLWSTIP
ncbi:MAG: hypothetical protein J3Q66DRAFT_156709 [Benniella sp.]|nr:MAG: hypothetical protein J3Q66DRAFT_156709 [Benniella sp.]